MAELCSPLGAVAIIIDANLPQSDDVLQGHFTKDQHVAAQTLKSRKTKRAFRSTAVQVVKHACSIDVVRGKKRTKLFFLCVQEAVQHC